MNSDKEIIDALMSKSIWKHSMAPPPHPVSIDQNSAANSNANFAANSNTNFGGRHSIWMFFDVSHAETRFYFCGSCNSAYTWPPSTTVAGRHLRDKHPEILRRVKQMEAERRQGEAAASSATTSEPKWMAETEATEHAEAGQWGSGGAEQKQQQQSKQTKNGGRKRSANEGCMTVTTFVAEGAQLIFPRTKHRRREEEEYGGNIYHSVGAGYGNEPNSVSVGCGNGNGRDVLLWVPKAECPGDNGEGPPAEASLRASSAGASASKKRMSLDERLRERFRCHANSFIGKPMLEQQQLLDDCGGGDDDGEGQFSQRKKDDGERQPTQSPPHRSDQLLPHRRAASSSSSASMDGRRRRRSTNDPSLEQRPNLAHFDTEELFNEKNETHNVINENEVATLRREKEQLEMKLAKTNDKLKEALATIERTQFEGELSRSEALSAKDTEMEEIRAQCQRQIHSLGVQLDELSASNALLLRQNQQNGRLLMRPSTGSLLDLSQKSQGPSFATSQQNLTNRYKQKLSRAMALLHQSQQNSDREKIASRLSQGRALREQLDSSECALMTAQRAQLAAEEELKQLRGQFDEAQSTKLAAEQRILAVLREKNAASATGREVDEQLQEALKREYQLTQQAQVDFLRMNEQVEQISSLELELRVAKSELSKLVADADLSARNCVEKRRLEMAELKARDLMAKLDTEKGLRKRAEFQIATLKDELEAFRDQLSSLKKAKERETEAQRRLRKELQCAQDELLQAKRHEAEMGGRQRAMKMDLTGMEEQLQNAKAELKLAKRQLEIMQTTFGTENAFSAGFSPICGSELGDFDDLLVETEEQDTEGAAANGRSQSDNLLQNGGSATTTAVSSSSSSAAAATCPEEMNDSDNGTNDSIIMMEQLCEN